MQAGEEEAATLSNSASPAPKATLSPRLLLNLLRKFRRNTDFTASYASELKMLIPNSPTKIKTPTKLFQLQHLWVQVLFQKVRNTFQHYDLISLSCLL